MADDAEWTPKQDMSLLCRVCANQHDYLIPIFQGEGLDHDMPTKMDKHLPIKVRESDKLPTQMCYQCASTIIAWSELHTNCLAADKKLKGMLRINEKKMGVVDTADDDAGSDHYEDAYDDGGGGGDDDDEDFEKEIKQLISDAGVELGSKTAKASKRPSRAAATRKRKSEVTITPVKRETKKPKTEPSASKSSTALLKPKEEVVSNEDRCMIWACCKCIAKYTSWPHLRDHLLSHSSNNDHSEQDICVACNTQIESHFSSVLDRCISCSLCDQVFTEERIFSLHLTIEHSTKMTSFVCLICKNQLFSHASSLRKHMEEIHSVGQFEIDLCVVRQMQDIAFSCQVCNELSILSKFCANHNSSQESPSIVDDCNQEWPSVHGSINNINMHQCITHDGSHSCQLCSESFNNCNYLWIHMFIVHDDGNFKCNLCSSDCEVTITNVFSLERHMQNEHSLTMKLEKVHHFLRAKTKVLINDCKQFKCNLCSSLLLSFDKLKTHCRSVHSEIKVRCEVCCKSFNSHRKKDNHVEVVHRGVRKFPCDECGKRFGDQTNLSTHKRWHANDKRYVCEICGASFV